MTIDIKNPDFIEFCQTADSLEVVRMATFDNIRGLDRIALSKISARKQLPPGIRNMLLAYFFIEFTNKVYHRNDLSRLYDHWAAMKVRTMTQAEEMVQKDIHTVLNRLR